jgi:dTMP kinase
MDPIIAMKRVESRIENDGEKLTRFDAEDIEFHKTLRAAFLDIAKAEPERVFTLDADGSRGGVHTRVLYALTQKYPEFAGKLSRAS